MNLIWDLTLGEVRSLLRALRLRIIVRSRR